MIRLVLIGAGGHARNSHAAPLARYRDEHPGEVELVAVCDLDAAKARALQRDLGFRASYADIDAMLDAEQPDGAVCVLPVSVIAPVGIRLLERGLPCTIEKPPGDTPEAARRLLAAGRRTGTPHMVSVNRRFVPLLNRGREWAATAGPLRFVRASMFRHKRTEDTFFWGTAVHAVDAMRYLAGQVESCCVRMCRRDEVSAPWYEVALLFEGECAGTLHVFPTAGAAEETYELFGEGYRVRVDLLERPGGRASLQCLRNTALIVDEQSAEGAPDILVDGSYEETCAFVSALRDGTPLAPTLEDVFPSLELCFGVAEQCRRAASQKPWTWEPPAP
jgi:predicted dehydrogenase